MLEDCNTGVAWVLDHCQSYGGDPNNVFIVGQSAGGHLMSVSLLGQVWQRQNGGSVVGGTPSWDVTRVKGFVGVSGAYNLLTLADHMHRRGLYKHMLASIMQGPEGQPWLEELSPTCLAKKLDPGVAAGVPPVLLLHGTADNSVPIDNAEEYAAALEGAGIKCRLKKYPGKTHTQPIVEDPMRGGQDQLMDEVLSLVRGEKCSNKQFPMLPSMLIDAATWVCPF